MGQIDDLIDDFSKIYSKKFEWGKSDCCTLVLLAEQRMTGTTKFPKINYDTEKGANQYIKGTGHDNLFSLFSSQYPEINKNFIQRGDIFGHIVRCEQSLGIWMGNYGVAQGMSGLSFVNLKDVKKAWSWVV